MRALQYLSRAVSAEQLSGVRNVGAYVMAMITDPRHAREPGPRDRDGGGSHHRGGARGNRDGRRGDKCVFHSFGLVHAHCACCWAHVLFL